MVTARPLFTAQYATNAQVTYYTSVGVRTIIDKFTGHNGTGGAVTLAVNLVPASGAAGAGNLLVTRSLSAGETYNFPEIAGHVLESGGFISVIAGANTSIVIRSSGREVTS